MCTNHNMQNQTKRGRKEAYHDGGRRKGGKEEGEEKGRPRRGKGELDGASRDRGEQWWWRQGGGQGRQDGKIGSGGRVFNPYQNHGELVGK